MVTTYDRLVSLLEFVSDESTIAFLIASAWSQESISMEEANKLCGMHGISDILSYWR